MWERQNKNSQLHDMCPKSRCLFFPVAMEDLCQHLKSFVFSNTEANGTMKNGILAADAYRKGIKVKNKSFK